MVPGDFSRWLFAAGPIFEHAPVRLGTRGAGGGGTAAQQMLPTELRVTLQTLRRAPVEMKVL